MKKNKGFTPIELIVVILIIAMLIAILWPARSRVKYVAMRRICGTKLKGLGTSTSVYARDYDGYFPQLPGNGPWSKELGFSYDNENPEFNGVHANTSRTITASLYLLVRYVDADPRIFVCLEGNEVPFKTENSQNLDISKLWDFGSEPYEHISFSIQNPYGKFPLHDSLPSGFAMAADMNPWFHRGNIVLPGENPNSHINSPQILNVLNKESYLAANSQNHDAESRESFKGRYKYPGQNILFADGRCEYENTPNVGINNDNIYTYWSTIENPTEQDIQGGTAPTGRNPENDSKSKDDSFLVL